LNLEFNENPIFEFLDNAIVDKSLGVAIRIVNLYSYLRKEKDEYISIHNDATELYVLPMSIIKSAKTNNHKS